MQELTAHILNIQHFSTEDGPGIRSTVFFQGCPLRCAWCANPESQRAVRQLAHRAPVCVHCGKCLESCPQKALSVGSGQVRIDRQLCVSCGTCVSVCPAHAMFFYGEEKTVDEVFRELMKDAGFYRDCGGGITCSGGECMLQAEFVRELFLRCRAEGLHTALDTCGQFPRESLSLVKDCTDLVLFDLKHMDSGLHKRYTGFGNEQILENLEECVRMGLAVYIRIPIIPGYNDSVENLTASAEYIRQLDPSLHVDLLPYHRFGENKYGMLGLPYALEGIQPPAEEQMKKYRRIFTDRGLDCAAH